MDNFRLRNCGKERWSEFLLYNLYNLVTCWYRNKGVAIAD